MAVSSNGNSLCLFCSYFNGPEIPEYVYVYLHQLKRNFTEVIFLTDNKQLSASSLNFLESEKISLKQYLNEGFDFGMWSKALNEISLDSWDEIAMVNDSCILFREPDESINAIRNSGWDYAGLVASKQVKWHIQSYFVIMRKAVFSDVLQYFNDHGLKQNFEDVIVGYEVGLSSWLQEKGYKLGAVFGVPGNTTLNPSFMEIDKMIASGFPLIKRKLITGSYRIEEIRGLLIRNFNFNPEYYISLIRKNVASPLLNPENLKSGSIKWKMLTLISPILSFPFSLMRKLGLKK